MTVVAAQTEALLAAPKAAKPPAAETLLRIAQDYGVGPFRQWREIFKLRYGPGKLASHEYVSTGAFRPDLSMEQKREFVGRDGSYELNIAANPIKLTVSRGFLRDKVMYTQLIGSLGLRTTHTQALVHGTRFCGDIPALRTWQDVAAFLFRVARYPLFGKPVEGAGSIGSVLIERIDAKAGRVHLSNGKDLDLETFAREVVDAYPEGFVFQSAIRQHDTMSAVTGAAVGTLRVVTLRDAAGVSTLYTVWKIPSPTAMSDNYWQNGSMIAEVSDSGQVGRCAQGTGPGYAHVETHPVSGARFEGIQLPHWDDLHGLVQEAHALFPEFGVIGWDVAMTPDGPMIVEANDNPYHVLYQLAVDRGARNSELLPRFEAAAAESERIFKARVKTFQARKAAAHA